MKNLKLSLLLICCFLITCLCHSQTSLNSNSFLSEPAWNWSKKYAGNGGPLSSDIISDGSGNYYLTGHFNGSLTFNNITLNSAGVSDMFLVKTNSAGNAIWVKQISASVGKSIIPVRLVLLGNGNILVGGHFDGTALFPANSLISSGHTDAFVARFDASGNNIQAGKYSDPESLSSTGLAADAAGNSYMTVNVSASNKAKIISFISSCQPVYSKSYDHAYFTDIACRNSNIYISGQIDAATSFGSISLSSGWYPSSFTGQADLSGNFTWADNGKSATGDSRAFSVSVDNSGNVYSSGFFIDSIRFNPASSILLAEGDYPLFIVKYSPGGTCLWASQIGEADAYNYRTKMTLDTQGNPYVSGYSFQDFTFGASAFQGPGYFTATWSGAGTKQWAKKLPEEPVRSQILQGGEMIQCANRSFNSLILKFDAAAALEWTSQSTSDGGSSDVWYQIAVDHQGMPYMHGHSLGTNYFNGSHVMTSGASLAKLNGDGSVIWQKNFTRPNTQTVDPSGVATDMNNNCFAWGVWTDSLSIEGNLLINPRGSGNMGYLVKYDQYGSLIWVRSFEAYGGLTGVGGITTDRSGSVAISGWFYDTLHVGNTNLVSHNNGNNSDVFAIKYDAVGSLVFAKSFGGTAGIMGRSISSDAQNNIYLCGVLRGTADFGGNSLTSMGSSDVFLTKYDAAGNLLWARQAGSPGNERGYAVISDSVGNSYISGMFWSKNMSFGSISITSPWSANLFLAKYAPDGTPLWGHAFRSPIYTWPAYQIGLDEEGNCYTGGNYTDTLVFENGQTFTGTWNNNFLVKYNSDGLFQWNKNIPMSVFSNGFTDLFGIAAYNKNSILIGGRIINDTLTLGSTSLFSYNSGAYLALLGENLPVGISGPSTVSRHLSVYPNPSHGIFTLRFDDPSSKIIRYSLTDAGGITVFSGIEICHGTASICLPQLSPGTYLISVFEGINKYSQKLILY